MWEPRRLTILRAFTPWYKDSFTFFTLPFQAGMVPCNGNPFPSSFNPLSVPVHRLVSLDAVLHCHNLRLKQSHRACACVRNRTAMILISVRVNETRLSVTVVSCILWVPYRMRYCTFHTILITCSGTLEMKSWKKNTSSFIAFVCPSVRCPAEIRESFNGFSWNIMFGSYTEFVRLFQLWLKLGNFDRHLTRRPIRVSKPISSVNRESLTK
jgi:hypothetical protein